MFIPLNEVGRQCNVKHSINGDLGDTMILNFIFINVKKLDKDRIYTVKIKLCIADLLLIRYIKYKIINDFFNRVNNLIN